MENKNFKVLHRRKIVPKVATIRENEKKKSNNTPKKNETEMFVVKPDLLKKFGINLNNRPQSSKVPDSSINKLQDKNIFKLPDSPKTILKNAPIQNSNIPSEGADCSISAVIPEDLSNLKIDSLNLDKSKSDSPSSSPGSFNTPEKSHTTSFKYRLDNVEKDGNQIESCNISMSTPPESQEITNFGVILSDSNVDIEVVNNADSQSFEGSINSKENDSLLNENTVDSGASNENEITNTPVVIKKEHGILEQSKVDHQENQSESENHCKIEEIVSDEVINLDASNSNFDSCTENMFQKHNSDTNLNIDSVIQHSTNTICDNIDRVTVIQKNAKASNIINISEELKTNNIIEINDASTSVIVSKNTLNVNEKKTDFKVCDKIENCPDIDKKSTNDNNAHVNSITEYLKKYLSASQTRIEKTSTDKNKHLIRRENIQGVEKPGGDDISNTSSIKQYVNVKKINKSKPVKTLINIEEQHVDIQKSSKHIPKISEQTLDLQSDLENNLSQNPSNICSITVGDDNNPSNDMKLSQNSLTTLTGKTSSLSSSVLNENSTLKGETTKHILQESSSPRKKMKRISKVNIKNKIIEDATNKDSITPVIESIDMPIQIASEKESREPLKKHYFCDVKNSPVVDDFNVLKVRESTKKYIYSKQKKESVQKILSADLQNNTPNISLNENINKDSTVPLRRRGRPRKIVSTSNDDIVYEKINSTEDTPSKRCRRPPTKFSSEDFNLKKNDENIPQRSNGRLRKNIPGIYADENFIDVSYDLTSDSDKTVTSLANDNNSDESLKSCKKRRNKILSDEGFESSATNIDNVADSSLDTTSLENADETSVTERNMKRNYHVEFVERDNNELLNIDPTIINDESKFPRCKCGVCSESMLLRDFHRHSLSVHNLLAWIEGEEPIDLNDKYTVSKILEKKLKMKMKLKCYNCGEIRSSTHGFFSHMSRCQTSKEDIEELTKEYQCGVCSETMLLKDFKVHSIEKHNYLAWRNGEQPIDYFNRPLIIGLLKKKMKIDPNLICEKCEYSSTNPTVFYSHILNCKISVKMENQSNNCKCAVCNETMPSFTFYEHNLHKHNLLAWIEGENPIDLNDWKAVEKILKVKIKLKMKLKCEKCGTVKLSAYGFYGHMLQCQKTEEERIALRVKCKFCDKTLFPTALYGHMLTSHSEESKNVKNSVQNSEVTEEPANTSRKRRAATLATQSLKDIAASNDKNELLNYIKICPRYFKRPTKVVTIFYLVDKRWKKQQDSGQPMTCGRRGCKYKTEDENEMKKHFLVECEEISQKYRCNYCNFMSTGDEEMANHILEDHKDKIPKSRLKNVEADYKKNEDDNCDVDDENSNTDSDDYYEDDYDDLDSNNKRRKKSTPSKQNQIFSAAIAPYFSRDLLQIKDTIYKEYAKIFVQKNYSNEMLFPEFDCNEFIILDDKEAKKYLPIDRESCKIAHVTYGAEKNEENNYDWKTYKILESSLNNGVSTIWTGGSVWCLSWIPGERSDSFLAVAPDLDFDASYQSHALYSHVNTIQFYNLGTLSDDVGYCETKPEFMFAIAHDYGIVWDMVWCPSGCDNDCNRNIFDNSLESSLVRMGLMAISCSNGISYIFAVPHPRCLSERNGKIFKVKPNIELHLCKDGTHTAQARKITWSPRKGHKIIAVGYSNGFVALYDLTITSPLLRSEYSDTVRLLPYFKFNPYIFCINGLSFVPEFDDEDSDDGYAIGVSSSAGCSIWLNSTRLMKKDGWASNLTVSYPWPQVIMLSEKIINPNKQLALNHTVVALTSRYASGVEISLGPAEHFLGFGSIDTSLWNNQLAISSSCGHTMIYQINTPLAKTVYSAKNTKGRVYKVMVMTNSESVPLSGQPIRPEMPFQKYISDLKCHRTEPLENFKSDTITYEDTKNTYGLVLQDFPLIPEAKKLSDSFRPSQEPVDRWPLKSYLITKMSLSSKSESFYACGGRAGHVRIMSTKYFRGKF